MTFLLLLVAGFLFLTALRFLAGLSQAVAAALLVVIAAVATLPTLDLSWARELWKIIEIPAIATGTVAALVASWIIVDRLQILWQHSHRPVFRIGADIADDGTQLWAVERREGWGWVEVRRKHPTQEAAIAWAEQQQAAWDAIKNRPKLFKFGRIYQKKIYK